MTTLSSTASRDPGAAARADEPHSWLRAPRLGDVTFATGLALLVGYAAWIGRDLWFFSDDWNIIAYHHTGNYLTPFNGHLVLLPIAIYHTLFVTAGLGSYWPYRVVGLASYALFGTLFYVYERRRVPPLLGALAALSIVWFSAAQLNVMFPFLMNFSLPLAATVAIWLALDRETGRADVAAGVFLAVALASSAIGLVTFAAVAVELALRRAPLRRWVPLLPPLILWVAWYVGYHTRVQSGSVGGTVRYALHEVQGTFAGFLGGWDLGGYLLLAATAVVFALAILRWHTFTARAAGALGGFAAFVVLTAYSRIGIVPAIPANEGRYIWLNGFFVVVALLEVLRGLDLSPLVYAAAAVVVAVGAVTLVGNLRDYRSEVAQNERSTRTFIVAVQAIPNRIDRSRIIRPFSYVPVRVGPFLDAVAHLGSPLPHARLDELGTETERTTADRWLVHDLGLRLAPVAPGTAPCVGGAPSSGRITVRGPVTVDVTAGPAPVSVSVRRLAARDEISLGSVAPGTRAQLRLPADASTLPWHVLVAGSAVTETCR